MKNRKARKVEMKKVRASGLSKKVEKHLLGWWAKATTLEIAGGKAKKSGSKQSLKNG